MPDGKYRSVYARSYKEVKEKKKKDQDLRCLCKHSKQEEPSELFELWLKNNVLNKVKPSTYENYYRCVHKYVIPFFKEVESGGITASSVSLFVNSIDGNQKISASYRKKILSVFKTALREILRDSTDLSSVLRMIKLPKIENGSVQVFSVREQRLVENTIFQSDDKRALGILLCFYTGIRLGELCALRWSDLDFEAGTMSIVRTVSRTKNFEPGTNKTVLLVGTPKSQKSVRKIPLPDFLLRLFDQWKCEKEDNYIFSDSAAPMDPRTYQRFYQRILADSGVPYRKFHAIRHSFATRALELGVDIKTLSELLGHSNVSITLNIYAHSLMEQKKVAIEKFNQMYITHMELSLFAVKDLVASV
ncbi:MULTISPECIES: tyrosine-type recombinase/integrase [Acutalibacteraceae]|uniref:tyrosine-type recombinase/integrase n=1 Tax=Acutalibacteraceae TaxID=3082771 RepID=UPI002E140506|nr:tyrosine-type recombinase/integrase [Caproicibacter sp. BJN0012]